jgi:hypothetical protein
MFAPDLRFFGRSNIRRLKGNTVKIGDCPRNCNPVLAQRKGKAFVTNAIVLIVGMRRQQKSGEPGDLP